MSMPAPQAVQSIAPPNLLAARTSPVIATAARGVSVVMSRSAPTRPFPPPSRLMRVLSCEMRVIPNSAVQKFLILLSSAESRLGVSLDVNSSNFLLIVA